MAEGTYEYECMRAELLGVDKPDYEEFVRRKEAESKEAEEEALTTEQLKELSNEGEELRGTTGKLDELNSILAATQKKIDRFKFRCGSVTELIKTKIGSISGTASPAAEEVQGGPQDESGDAQEAKQQQQNGDVVDVAAAASSSAATDARKSDLTRALDNHVDTLDAMLEKAENAQYSMSVQNKQMRSFLK